MDHFIVFLIPWEALRFEISIEPVWSTGTTTKYNETINIIIDSQMPKNSSADFLAEGRDR